MEIIISNSSSVPIYEQIKEQIKAKIVSGKLHSGERLPSIRSLARDLEVSIITTKNAYTDLEKEGYVQTIPSKGVYISSQNVNLLREEQLKKLEYSLDNAITFAKLNNIDKKEVENIIDLLYEEE